MYHKIQDAAAATITANYEIGHNLKNIQVRDPFFVLDPCFQGQGMQWSYHLRSTITATTSKFKMATVWVKNGVLRLNTYSRGVILLWELQIYGSINYWLWIAHGLQQGQPYSDSASLQCLLDHDQISIKWQKLKSIFCFQPLEVLHVDYLFYNYFITVSLTQYQFYFTFHYHM